jgi:peptide/nickel transport system substrate-binding protein
LAARETEESPAAPRNVVAWPGAAWRQAPPPRRRPRRPRGRRTGLLLLGVLVALALAGGLAVGARAAYYAWTHLVPAEGGQYVEAYVGQPDLLNPLLGQQDPVDREFLPLLFAGLTRLGSDGQALPDLAERWDVSPDGRTYTFVLRPNLRWSDGTPLEAADVAFTFSALSAPDFPADADFLAPWRAVSAEALDARTVRVSLTLPWAGFLEAATLGIVPRAALAGTSGRDWRSHPFNGAPIGAGPYRVVDFTAQELTLAPNDRYHGPRPHLTDVRFRFFETLPAAQQAVLAGDADGVALRGGGDLATVRANPEFRVYQRPDYARSVMLWLNTTAAPFDDKAVRAAVAAAINRDTLVAALGGTGEAARGPLPPTSWAYADLPFPAYARARAESLLDAAGWRQASGSERQRGGAALSISLATNDDPARRAAADAIARDLRAVGFRVQVEVKPWVDLAREELAQRKFQAVLLGQWTPTADPDGLRDLWGSDGVANLAGWRNPRADELLLHGAALADPAARKAAYADFQRLWAEEVPSLPLYYPLLTWATRAEYQGVDLAPLPTADDRLGALPAWYVRTSRVFRGW